MAARAVAELRHARRKVERDANLEIIGECGTGGVRGSFLPFEADRLPSQAGEQPKHSTDRPQVALYSDTLYPVWLKTQHSTPHHRH